MFYNRHASLGYSMQGDLMCLFVDRGRKSGRTMIKHSRLLCLKSFLINSFPLRGTLKTCCINKAYHSSLEMSASWPPLGDFFSASLYKNEHIVPRDISFIPFKNIHSLCLSLSVYLHNIRSPRHFLIHKACGWITYLNFDITLIKRWCNFLKICQCHGRKMAQIWVRCVHNLLCSTSFRSWCYDDREIKNVLRSYFIV